MDSAVWGYLMPSHRIVFDFFFLYWFFLSKVLYQCWDEKRKALTWFTFPFSSEPFVFLIKTKYDTKNSRLLFSCKAVKLGVGFWKNRHRWFPRTASWGENLDRVGHCCVLRSAVRHSLMYSDVTSRFHLQAACLQILGKTCKRFWENSRPRSVWRRSHIYVNILRHNKNHQALCCI
jgi:hypothetical protein